jgi:enoyl-CoA hydratase/carnithine racemase
MNSENAENTESPENSVLFEEMPGEGGKLGIITLNRPQVLNSLNHHMIKQMFFELSKWAINEEIKAVVICAAEGRAFCAGGDLRLTYEKYKANDPTITHFFRDEYQLNRLIFHFPKPYIALLDGITMGGGVGISIHGSHRLATDNLLFAMPETGIGFFPDVGGTYFLPRLRNHMGIYAGLMGVRMKVDECKAINIVTHKVAKESLNEIITVLSSHAFTEDPCLSVTQLLRPFDLDAKHVPLIEQQELINDCFSKNSMEDILSALNEVDETFGKDAVDTISKKSPTSLEVSLLAMQLGKGMDFDSVMRQEYRLVSRFLQGHDFFEGIRALIIDKDQKPHWRPDSLGQVTEAQIQHYFAPLTQELA